MHYEERSFARDPSRRVIEPRPEFAAQARRMGLATQPSILDRQALALVYNAGGATSLRFDTQEIHRTMLRLDTLYTTELKRPNGLSTGGEPDFAGVATWIFNVYLVGAGGRLDRERRLLQRAGPDQPVRGVARAQSWRTLIQPQGRRLRLATGYGRVSP